MKLKVTPVKVPNSVSLPLNSYKIRHYVNILGSELLTGRIELADGTICLIDLNLFEGIEIEKDFVYKLFMETDTE